MKRIRGSKKNRIKAVLLITAGPFLVHPLGIRAQEATEATTVNQLIKKIQERDQVIADLQWRVQQLEQRMGGGQQASESTMTAQPAGAPSTEAVAGPVARQTPVKEAATETPPVASQPGGQTPVKKTATETLPAVAQSKTGPGSFAVDEEAAERALERTLVQTGALLLPFGLAEIQPYVNYVRLETQQPILIQDPAGSIAAVPIAERRRNDIEAGVFSRFGLPFGAQAELAIPARVINESNVIGIVNRETVNTMHMLGDIRVGLAKTLLRESAWLPDIVGRIT